MKNLILNCALGNFPNDDIQQIYLDILDELTLSHHKMLWFINEYKGKKEEEGKLLADEIFHEIFPNFDREDGFYEHLLAKLLAKKLIADNGPPRLRRSSSKSNSGSIASDSVGLEKAIKSGNPKRAIRALEASLDRQKAINESERARITEEQRRTQIRQNWQHKSLTSKLRKLKRCRGQQCYSLGFSVTDFGRNFLESIDKPKQLRE